MTITLMKLQISAAAGDGAKVFNPGEVASRTDGKVIGTGVRARRDIKSYITITYSR